jgi:acetyltransferase-like isoleucine patch superfamily enzyme
LSGIEKGARLLGSIKLGKDVSIGTPAEINGGPVGCGTSIEIGDGCDIASYVTITTLSSHKRCLGLAKEIERASVFLGEHVFVGQGAIILAGTRIGHHSVIGAGVVLSGQTVPPYSRVKMPVPSIEPGYYLR